MPLCDNRPRLALALLLALAVPAPAAPPAGSASSSFIRVSPAIDLMFGPGRPSETGIDDRFITFVDGAKSTLDMAFYEFRLESIVNAVIRAKRRGVAVRVVTDSDNYWARSQAVGAGELAQVVAAAVSAPPKSEGDAAPDPSALNPFVRRLVEAGIPVRPDERSGLMHDKFAVRDGAEVWTGSYNLTDTCSYRNANNAVILRAAPLAALFSAEFREMFEDGAFGVKSPAHPKREVVDVGGTPVEVYFAPEDDPNERIAELLAGARRSIRFMQFAFTADDLGAILVERAAAGVEVRGILDRALYRSTGPYGEFARLVEAQVPVIIYDAPGKFHHKVFIVDAEGEDPLVILGSQNASSNGNRANDENVLVFRSREMARRFDAEFRRLFGTTAPVTTGIVSDDLPLAGADLSTVDLYVHANGNRIGKIAVDFPARWKVDGPLARSVSVRRGGVDTTAKEALRVTPRSIELASANLEGWGPKSFLVLRVEGLRLPLLPGLYAVPVRVAAPGAAEFKPVAHPPAIQVIDGETANGFGELLDYVGRANAKLDAAANAALPPAELERLKAHVRALNTRLFRLTVTCATHDRFELVALAAGFLERQSPRWRRYALDLTANFKDLLTALKARSVSPEGRSAVAPLIARFEAIARSTP